MSVSLIVAILTWSKRLWEGLRTNPSVVGNIFVLLLRGGADKSLARPTSRCRRMASIALLERGVCSCAELQVFSCYRGWKEACQATCAISTTSSRELSSSFFSCKAKHQRKFTPFWQKHLGKHAPSYATVKNWVAQFKRGDFPTCDAPHPGWPKTGTSLEIIDQIHELILEECRILAKSIAEHLGNSCEWVGFIIHEDLDMRKLSGKWVPKCLNYLLTYSMVQSPSWEASWNCS